MLGPGRMKDLPKLSWRVIKRGDLPLIVSHRQKPSYMGSRCSECGKFQATPPA